MQKQDCHPVITEDCINCGACILVCPMEAIEISDSGNSWKIYWWACNCCWACARECPVSAITDINA
ncbi:4Fe-4S binding protein [Carboxylicivirga mesophila]|uniref:4Fe-4S binding protein n=2 Tax=Carboxylicivirga mesophila TaxID=1166478 RepID=A0ABS5K610_9BACT|nr:4Fe-4S binding protein [Carboxylicivirga mesophila]